MATMMTSTLFHPWQPTLSCLVRPQIPTTYLQTCTMYPQTCATHPKHAPHPPNMHYIPPNICHIPQTCATSVSQDDSHTFALRTAPMGWAVLPDSASTFCLRYRLRWPTRISRQSPSATGSPVFECLRSLQHRLTTNLCLSLSMSITCEMESGGEGGCQRRVEGGKEGGERRGE